MNEPASLATGREVWDHLITDGGLDPDGWDAPVVDALRTELGLGGGLIADELAASSVSPEAIIYALFRALEPFTAMMGDLLALFERHGIRESDGGAEIVFDFDEPGRPQLSFDLESFRRTQEIWARVTAPMLEMGWFDHAWELWRLLDDATDRVDWYEGISGTREWVDPYRDGEWPPRPLAVPRSGSASLDRELARAAGVWGAVVNLFQSHAPGRDDLMRALREPAGQDGDPIARRLARIEHDYYVLQLASAIIAASQPNLRTGDSQELAAELQDFLDTHPFGGDLAEALIRGLFDVLDLPLWKRRHELYAVWVLAELLASVRVETRLLESEPGVLRFPFRATQMAELVGCDHTVTVWSELRTPLVDPVGKSRKAGVQPDYSVLVDAAERQPEASVLEIECKQYKRAASRSFAAALVDYARARPNALVVLVNHGPLNRDRLVAAVPNGLRARTDAVGELHPLNPVARERFRGLVDRTLAPLCPRPVLVCQLAWDGPPSDLDLHLFAASPSTLQHVSWEDLGRLEEPPFAALAADVVEPGSVEELTVDRWVDATRYVLAVHAYSDDGPLAGSGASIRLEQPGRIPVTLACPGRGSGTWWYVAEIDLDRRLSPVQQLSDRPPV